MSRKSYLTELLALGAKELVQQRKVIQKNLFQMKMQNIAGSLKKSSDITAARKNIARINTVLSHKIATLYGSSVK